LIVRAIFDLIKKINIEGITILLVEQNARMALSISNRGYVLETGKIVLSGTKDNLLNNPEIQDAYLGGRIQTNKEN
jgi:branched-chain amino acid transport system ATP-binding protein